MAHTRAAWGMAGLLGFELILVAYALGFDAVDFALVALAGAALLAVAVWRAARGLAPLAGVFVGLAAVMLARGIMQSTSGVSLTLAPTYLLPLGFALLAVSVGRRDRRLALAGIVLVALARSWFFAWYLLGENATLLAANALGAAGAWLWATARAGPEPETRAAPA